MGLIASDVIALDTNVFVYAIDTNSPHHSQAKKTLDFIQEKSVRTFISVLVFHEFLVGIYKQRLEKYLSQYEDLLTARGLITPIEINLDICRTSAQLRSKYPTLKTPDALHLACALHAPAKKFLTFDRRLPKKVERIAIINLT